jgi:DNA polymerase alpha subunit A
LTELCQLQLGTKRFEIGDEKAVKKWTSNAKGLMDFVGHAEADTFFIAAIALKVMILPLTRQLTNIAGNSWYGLDDGTDFQGAHVDRYSG